MMNNNIVKRYDVILIKDPREILLLRGVGCKWRKCTFCDYHLDSNPNKKENFILNKIAIDQVTGQFGKLEIVNSGSVVDLDDDTINYIISKCEKKHIYTVIFESHWIHRYELKRIKEYFKKFGITVKFKAGVETFNIPFREQYLNKGFKNASPQDIAAYFDQVNLLQGLPNQTSQSMENDINIGLENFERVCVNIMQKNTTSISPSINVVNEFIKNVMPKFIRNKRVDILLKNTDFGIGEKL